MTEEEEMDSFTIGTAAKKRAYYNSGNLHKICTFCGKSFKTSINRQEHCSHKCAVLKSRHNKNPLMGTKIGIEKKCIYCGITFQDFSKNCCKKYCSIECIRKYDIPRSLNRIKRAAIKRKIPFDLKKEDIVIPKFCPYLGIPLDKNSKFSYNKPSVDRIDNSLGYTKDNIQIVSNAINCFKADMPIDVWNIIKKRYFKNDK